MEMDQIEFVRHQASEASEGSKALYAHPEYWPALLNTPPTQCQSITQIDLPISIESILDCHLSCHCLYYYGCIDKCFPIIFMGQNKHKETIWVCNTNPPANGLFVSV